MLPETIIPLEEVKVLLLDLVTDLDAFCRQRGLRYSLAYGSLIGAVRHQGFIPWDDDIDIFMPRPDYLRLIQTYHHPFYEVRSQETDIEFPLNFAKLCDTRTLSIDQFGNKFPISVDIFILDGLGDSLSVAKAIIRKTKRMQRVWSSQRFTNRLSISRQYNLKKNLIIFLSKVISPFFSIKHIVEGMCAFKQSHSIDESKYCASLDEEFFIYETAKMIKYTDAPFEDRFLRIPEDYDYELKLIYGDYMQLPPEDQQVVTHGTTSYWVNK